MVNNAFNIANEGDTSMIIAHFDTNFIFNIIEDNLIRRIDIYQSMLPNIVSAIEQNFKITYNREEVQMMYANEALDKRNDLYRTIIQLLCSKHNMQFNELEGVDLYSLSLYLYDFLVSGFRKYLIDFFSLYIYKEKNEIYNAFNLHELKKNKDSSTLYGKKLYKNQKVAIINANLDYILAGIASFDISLNDILNTVYENKSIVKYLLNNVQSMNDFFKDVYVPIICHPYYRQSIITDIRIALHQIACNTNNE